MSKRGPRLGRGQVLSVAVALLLLAGLVAIPVLAMAEEHEVTEPDADRTHIDIRVDADGDALWTVSYRIELPSEEDRAAFDDLAAAINEDPEAYLESYRDRMSSSATAAESTTDREMAIEEVTVRTETTELPEPTGIVEYEFRWTNFAEVDGSSLLVGDAIDGLFLDGETSLLIAGPDGWTVQSASPEPTDERSDAAIWRGPYEFGTDEPRVTVAPPDESFLTSVPVSMVLTVVTLFAIVGIGTWVGLQYRDKRTPGPPGESPTSDDGEVDMALLSNEEQVIRVLEDNGGRLKQKELAEELDWTAAKTSQVTTELREEGTIEGFRLGRENVLKLPDGDE